MLDKTELVGFIQRKLEALHRLMETRGLPADMKNRMSGGASHLAEVLTFIERGTFDAPEDAALDGHDQDA